MNLNALGTDTFLRYQIESKLVEIRRDDYLIESEGVDSLDISELLNACLARGIRTVGVSPVRMRQELSQWLDLHLKNKVPSTLLLLSHAFQTTDRFVKSDDALKTKAEALQATLSSLPHQVVNEAQLKISELEGSATYKQKLEVLKEQEEMIADELEEDSAHAKKKSENEKKKIEDEASLNSSSDTKKEAQIIPKNSKDQEPQGIPIIPLQINEIIESGSPLNSEITSQMMEVVEKQVEDVEGHLTEEELKVIYLFLIDL